MIKHYKTSEHTPMAVQQFCNRKGIEPPKSKARFDYMLINHMDEIRAIETAITEKHLKTNA